MFYDSRGLPATKSSYSLQGIRTLYLLYKWKLYIHQTLV